MRMNKETLVEVEVVRWDFWENLCPCPSASPLVSWNVDVMTSAPDVLLDPEATLKMVEQKG